MAAALDNSAVFTGSTIASPYTCSGTDRVLIVMAFNLSSSTLEPTTISYAGINFIRLEGVTLNTTTSASLWYMVAPPTGSNTLACSRPDGSTFDISVISLTGCTGKVQNFNSVGVSNIGDISIVSGASDMIVAGVFFTSGTVITADGGLTLDANDAAHQAVGHLQAATTTVGFSGSTGIAMVIGASLVGGPQVPNIIRAGNALNKNLVRPKPFAPGRAR